MGNFCGVLGFDAEKSNFNELRRLCGMGVGCAYAGNEFSVIYSGDARVFEKPPQPVTVRHNGHLYTAVVISAEYPHSNTSLAAEILGRYFETGEGCLTHFNIPFAALIYDGRCGELLACRSGVGGAVPLFWAQKGERIYFSTSLFPLYKLFGGCIRVNKRVLGKYLCADIEPSPSDLFFDIRPIGCGRGVLCTRFGESEVDVHASQYFAHKPQALIGVTPPKSCTDRIEEVLRDALFTFGYPQFDCYMPAFLSEARRAAAQGLRAVRIQDATFDSGEYSEQRAYVLSELCGVRIISVRSRASLIGRHAMKVMEKKIDSLLAPYVDDSSSVLYSIFEDKSAWENKKSIPLRIRTKGMLYQTVKWLEYFNIVIE